MARKPKTPRFDAFNSFENCFGERQLHQGHWLSYLGPKGDLVLELGAGRADFALMYASLHEDKRVLAIDLKADRLFRGAKTALDQNIENIAFLQLNITRIDEEIEESSVSELWLTFPDPYPKDRQEKHRMSGLGFLEKYHSILISGGKLYLKTDNIDLFNWSKQQIKISKFFDLKFESNDLHSEEDYEDAKLITAYEKKFLQVGLKTNFLIAVNS